MNKYKVTLQYKDGSKYNIEVRANNKEEAGRLAIDINCGLRAK